MDDQDLIFSISEFLEESIGTRESYAFDIPIDFPDIDSRSNVTGKVEIMKLDNGFNVKFINLSVDVMLQCVRSLKPFIETIKVPMAERQFLMERPSDVPDPFDLYLVDKKRLEIDISEMLRQEIILHFPPIPVCYDGSSGGVGDYDHEEETPEHKPLAGLKDLIK